MGIWKHWPCPKVFLMTFLTSSIQWSTHKRARVKMSFLQTGYGKTEVWRLGETNRLRRWVGRDALRCVEMRWDAFPETKSTRDKAETPPRRNQGKPASVWSTVYCPTNAAWFLSIHSTSTKLAQLLPYELCTYASTRWHIKFRRPALDREAICAMQEAGWQLMFDLFSTSSPFTGRLVVHFLDSSRVEE